MRKTENWDHWERWAAEYGAELRATTKCLSIKRLEIEALVRRIQQHGKPQPLVVEVGCGNGANGFALVARTAGLRYLGLDFAPSMISNAANLAERRAQHVPAEIDRMAFALSDARELSCPIAVDQSKPHFSGRDVRARLPATAPDIVFTDRMLINLSSAEEQLVVMERIASILPEGGLFLMIENSVETHAALNEVRTDLGLTPRPPAEYNVFIDEERVIKPFARSHSLVGVDDFSAIHDLILYAVAPAMADGRIDYDSPLMTKLTDAIVTLGESTASSGGFGQNRLWIWRK